MLKFLRVCALSSFSLGMALSGSSWAATGIQDLRPVQQPQSYLHIYLTSGQLVKQLELPPEGRWCLYWEHSVAGFTVQDCFRERAGELLLESSRQPDFAAGLGHTPGQGQLISDEQGGYRLESINQVMANQQLRLRVGSSKVNHRIDYEQGLLELYPLVGQQVIILKLVIE